MNPEKNWAGNVRFGAVRWCRPESLEELQELVALSPKIRAVGTRHSFSRVADTPGVAVSLESFQETTLNPDARTVTVGAGVRYGELGQFLHQNGWALHNLASLPHINVVGAVSTATHGSGDGNGNLATAVARLERVSASGEIETLMGESLSGSVVSLGLLGVVTSVTLKIEPTYEVAQDVYEGLRFETLLTHFDEITSCGYSVSLFTDWSEHGTTLWRKRRESLTPPKTLFGATLASGPRHPLPGVAAASCTEQGGVFGPWHLRLPHFKLEFTPSHGDELQSEFFVPRERACEALAAVSALCEKIQPLLLISELRTVAKDSLWLSPHFERSSLGIHFTWKNNWPAVETLLPEIEAALAPFDARPHRGKLFTQAPVHPKLDAFEVLHAQLDPTGKFSSASIA
jgi:alditol oxidase